VRWERRGKVLGEGEGEGDIDEGWAGVEEGGGGTWI
jgi:hypothetical protein